MDWDGIGKELRSYGLKVQKVPGWRKRGRDGTFDPRGVMPHHTGSAKTSGNSPCLGIVTAGRSDLPGPLSNFLLARDGTIILVAAGRCNHAGYGGPIKGIPKDSGNAYLLGIEAENDGIGEAWTRVQLHAYAVLCRVVLERMNRTAYHTIAHREWTTRKIDPTFDMTRFRKRVRKVKKGKR